MGLRRVFLPAVLVMAGLTIPAEAQRLMVLPAGASSSTESFLSVQPFAALGAISGSAGAFLAFSKPDGSLYFIVAASGVVVVNSEGEQVQTPISIGAPVSSAALSPNGNRFVVTAGSSFSGALYVFDASAGTLSPLPTVTVGNNPYDVAVSPDSSTAYVISSAGIQAVDLGAMSASAPVPLAGVQRQSGARPGIAIGPNGLIYVNAVNAIYEIHPVTLATLNTIAVGGFPGRPSFSSDATAGVVANQLASNPQASVLDIAGHAVTRTLTGVAVLFDDISYVDANRIYASSSGVGQLFVFPANNPSSGIQEATFPSVGKIPNVVSMTTSNETPAIRYLFVVTTAGAYRVDLTSQSAAPATASLTSRAGQAFYLAPAKTGLTPANTQQFNGTQTLAVGAPSLPLLIRLSDSNGTPIADQAVAWAPNVVTLQSAMTLTNRDGVAAATATATAAGTYQIHATFPGTALASLTFALSVGGGSGGGDGGGGTAPPTGIAILSGNGQVTRSGYLTPEPMVVIVGGTSGHPVSGVPVRWGLGGQGGVEVNYADAGQSNCAIPSGGVVTCLTDANGLSSTFFRGAFVFPGGTNSFLPSQVTASISAQGSVVAGSVQFTESSVPATQGVDNHTGPLPLVSSVQPPIGVLQIEGQAGQTLSPGFQVTVEALNPVPLSMPNVGLAVRAGQAYTLGGGNPQATCVGGTVLTNAAGVATCDLVLGSTPGTYRIYRVVGGYDVAQIVLTIDPAPPVITEFSIVSGSPQSAPIGQALPNPLVVVVKDQFGNPMAGVSVRWAPVIAGTATLANTTTQTGANGRASNTVTLGNIPGAVQIRATAGGRTVTFNLTAAVVLTSLTKVGNGDNQTALINSAFTNPLTVQVNGTLGPVPNVQVTFSVTPAGGSATLDRGPIVLTGSQGQASVNVDAGAQAGPVEIVAAVAGLSSQTFNLTVRSPGPQLTLDSIMNGASFQAGFGFGSVVSIIAPGLTTGLNMPAGSCISAGTEASPLPTRLAGMEFQFGGLLAPIFAICRNADGGEQANVQAPFELAPVVPPPGISVTVRSGAGTANPVETTIDGVAVANAQPGIFEYLAGSQKVAVAVRVSDGSYIGPGNAAHPGDEIRVYVTGMGPVQPWVPTNRPGVGGQGMYFTPLVTLGGTPMGGVRAEYAENMIGIFVITFQIPSDQPTGAAVPLTVGVLTDRGATVTSAASQIAIQ